MRRQSRVNHWAALLLVTVMGCSVRAAPALVARTTPALSGSTQGPAPRTVAVPHARREVEPLALYDAAAADARDKLERRRQIAELRQAVVLYTAFLERATGRPELEPAVRKSQERRADALATIEFLLAGEQDATANERRE